MQTFATKSNTASAPAKRRSEEPALSASGHFLAFSIVAVAASVILGIVISSQENALMADARSASSQVDESGNLRPVALVHKSLEALAVITEIINSDVLVVQEDKSLFGDTIVQLKVPVRYFYATRLQPVGKSNIIFDALYNHCTVTISPPERVATEVMTEKPTEEVLEVGWARFKSMSGTTQLVKALKKTREEALKQELPPEHLARIRESARTRVQEMLQEALGPRFTIEVRFAE